MTCAGAPGSTVGEIQVRLQNASQLGRRGKGLGVQLAAKTSLGISFILHALLVHSSPSRSPSLTLSRSMLPLLTAENRACSPPPPPPLQLAVSPEILHRGVRSREEFAAEALHPGAGPVEGAAGLATALGWGRGKEGQQTPITTEHRVKGRGQPAHTWRCWSGTENFLLGYDGPLGGVCPPSLTFAQCLLLFLLSTLNNVPCIELGWGGPTEAGMDVVGR